MKRKYPVAPCKNCLTRSLNCHSKCEHYIGYRKEQDQFNEEQRTGKEKQLSAYFCEQYNKTIRK